MQQSKLASLIESLANTVIGFSINLAANLVILPLFGFDIKLNQAVWMGVVFTVISVLRGYVVRRYFNDKLHKMIYGDNK